MSTHASSVPPTAGRNHFGHEAFVFVEVASLIRAIADWN
jgi:hypothetical protein